MQIRTPTAANDPTPTRAPGLKGIRHGDVTVSGGVRLPYRECGDPSGHPLVLLHGYTDSGRSFEGVLPHLPESIRAIVPTLRGHGDSGLPVAGYSVGDFAGDVLELLDALGIDTAVVAGHSMGSMIARRLAVDRPDRLAGLVLIGTFAAIRANPDIEGLWTDVVSGLADPVNPAFVREFQEGTLARPVPRGFLDMVVDESLKTPARVWRAALQGMLQDERAAEFGNIDCPTLLVWGDCDAFAPRADQETLLAGIRGSRLLVYEGAGHGVHWEEPVRFARDVSVFVQEAARRAA